MAKSSLSLDIPKLSLAGEDQQSEVGCISQKSVADTYPIHTHDFFEFFYVVSGKAIHRINGTTQIISDGSLFFVRPSDIHAYSFLRDFDMELISCGMESHLVEEVCRLLSIDIRFILEPEFPPCLFLDSVKRWDVMKDFTRIKKKTAGLERKQYFLSILPNLIYLFYTKGGQQVNILPVWFANLLEQMNEPQNFTAGLPRMRELANVSSEYLNREFRKYLNLTPTEYINMKRIDYAGSLLLTRKYEITDICYQCGYNNLTYFYKMFKKAA